MTLQQSFLDNEINSGLYFILGHFEEPVFPRKIMTKVLDYQKEVYSIKQILDYFQQSNLLDIRINAYPCLTEYKDVPRYKPDFLFIDIDRNDPRFKTDRSFENALSNTLKNIKNKLDGNACPTVLFTGGGYHIYQPVYCRTAFENVTEFQKFDRPSKQFLRFAKDNLSNGKADKQNNPSFKSCLLRIPGSINSKYNSKVTIIQKWNGYRPPIPRELLIDFRRYLIQKKIDEQNERQKIMLLKLKRKNNKNNQNNTNINYYEWIETKILVNPFPDCRKLIVDLVLAPYLVNIKKLSYDESCQIIKDWLDKCNSIQKLDNYSNFVNYRIHSALKNVIHKPQIGPMSLYKIKTDDKYRKLYTLLLLNDKGSSE